MASLRVTTNDPENEISGDPGTRKNSRLLQHRRHLAPPFRRKIELIAEMCNESRCAIEQRKREGLPYIAPYTHRVVNP